MPTRREILDNLLATFASFADVIGRVPASQWAARSLCPAWTVSDVVVHVTAAEVALSGWPPGDQLPFTTMGPVVRELSALAPGALLDRHRQVVAARVAELEQMSDDEFDAPAMTPLGPATYGRFMAIRLFDVWVHERDIRVPLAMDGDDGGPSAEMALGEVDRSLGYIVGKKIGLGEGRSIVFDLTGPVVRRMAVKVEGRATRVEALDAPDAKVVTDSMTFMLLACGRIDPELAIAAGSITWSGDDEIGGRAARHLAFTM